mmetsp:Transcript_13282/g.24077  ORF Transcript_13282/g.24077 Transcript_13282/m.24077 type:complete len:275 (-) Transcript_13282:103-927(-)
MLMYLQRLMIYWVTEWRFRIWTPGSANDEARRLCTEQIKEKLGGDKADADLVEKCTPTYPPGCKRILIINNYYETLAKESTELCTNPIAEITEFGVTLKDTDDEKKKNEIPLDVLIYATGFQVFDSSDSESIGTEGARLTDFRRDDPASLYGITAEKFPNFFFLLGPNTGLGHNTVVWMAECQCEYIIDLMHKCKKRCATKVIPKLSKVNAFMELVNSELKKKVWVFCDSWYRHNKTNRVFALWPSSTPWYWWTIKSARQSDYEFSPRNPKSKI